MPGLPAETAKNVSDGAKSSYWGLVCGCWKLVTILTFRKGVIADREQRILKISLTCPCEAGSFLVARLECLKWRSREPSFWGGREHASLWEQFTASLRVATTFGYLPFQVCVNKVRSLLRKCSALNKNLDSVKWPHKVLRNCGSLDLKHLRLRSKPQNYRGEGRKTNKQTKTLKERMSSCFTNSTLSLCPRCPF